MEGRTWNPMMIAFDAAANMTSPSEICPTALWITFTWISGVDNLIKESDKASIEPSTSPFTMMFNSWKFPMAIRLPISSSVICFWVRNPCSRCSCSRLLAKARASFSLPMTLNLSPACGAPFKPSINAGQDGPASSILLPRSLNIAFTCPKYCPASTTSPMRNVPLCTSTVATYPRPLSSEDSMIEPIAFRFGLAFNSRISASSNTFSRSSSTFKPFLAEIS